MGSVEPTDQNLAALEAGIRDIVRELTQTASEGTMGLMANSRGNRLLAYRQGLHELQGRLPEYEEKMKALHLDLGIRDSDKIGARIADELGRAASHLAQSLAMSLRGPDRAAALREAEHFKGNVGIRVTGAAGRALVAVEKLRRQEQGPTVTTPGGRTDPLDDSLRSLDPDGMTDFGAAFADVLRRMGSEIEVTHNLGGPDESRRKTKTLKNREKEYPRREYFGFAPGDTVSAGDVLQFLGTNDRWTVIDTETQVAMNKPVQIKAFVEKLKAGSSLPLAPARAVAPTGSQKVFIVHGQDEEAKLAVQVLLQRLGLQGVVLHEQPNKGRTIIEKFEDHADVDFAVVLLTPDDVGGPAEAPRDALKARARQNVLFELGYFFAKLQRGHVCALLKGDVEIPSDISGIIWVRMDQAKAWQNDLARELHGAGLKVDMNRLLTT
jgi:predicted nucleotide-binding protein